MLSVEFFRIFPALVCSLHPRSLVAIRIRGWRWRVWGAERVPSPFLCTALDAHSHSHPRKTRTCCRLYGNSRFVSHLDFRASETIPHPLSVLAASLPLLSHPIPQHSVCSASYEPTKQLRRGFTREISPATIRCSNVREIRATSTVLSETRCTARPRTRIKIFRVEGYFGTGFRIDHKLHSRLKNLLSNL